MKLTKVQVKTYKNILDSGEVEIQPDVTCLVGKNESGKTAFLHALHRLNPAQKNVTFSIPDHYPAWLEKRHRRTIKLETVCPVMAIFQLEDSDIVALESRFGKGILTDTEITMRRQYDGTRLFDYEADEGVAVAKLLDQVQVPEAVLVDGDELKTFQALSALIATLKGKTDEPDAAKLSQSLERARESMLGKGGDFGAALMGELDSLTPIFFYYDEYSSLPGTVKIREILKADKTKLSGNLLTARALLDLGGAEDDYLLNPVYERRKRELQNVANYLTDALLSGSLSRCWLQVPDP